MDQLTTSQEKRRFFSFDKYRIGETLASRHVRFDDLRVFSHPLKLIR